MSEQVLKDRVAVVTGASRGIGRAAALAFAKAGAHVVAIARTQGALEELDDEIRAHGGSATLVPLDVSDLDAHDRLADAIFDRWGKLDILLLNAGALGLITPVRDLDRKVMNEVMSVNVTANWSLLKALDPALRASASGRVIAITSGAATRVKPYWGAYAMSKAALEVLIRSYAEETRTLTPIKAMLVSPGPMRTAMRKEARPGEDPMTLPPPEALAPDLVRIASADWTETGRMFDFQTGKVMDYQLPQPVA
jgi:NAD(P)-dependent dehydrogenase (short-subunit alcohol dehydrogenase family)